MPRSSRETGGPADERAAVKIVKTFVWKFESSHSRPKESRTEHGRRMPRAPSFALCFWGSSSAASSPPLTCRLSSSEGRPRWTRTRKSLPSNTWATVLHCWAYDGPKPSSWQMYSLWVTSISQLAWTRGLRGISALLGSKEAMEFERYSQPTTRTVQPLTIGSGLSRAPVQWTIPRPPQGQLWKETQPAESIQLQAMFATRGMAVRKNNRKASA